MALAAVALGPFGMLFAKLLAASERVAGTRSHFAKIDTLAECLRRLDTSG
jgi:hypothetical protein